MKYNGKANFPYHDWQVWQESMELLELVYPIEFGETSCELAKQLKRAILSISANIAEGSGRGGKAGANHFRIARGSLMEAQTLVEAAMRMGLLPEGSEESLERINWLLGSVFVQLNLMIKKMSQNT